MQTKNVTLETITPLFLGGAKPRGTPELRAASIRGMLRYWLRALLGGVLGNDGKKIASYENYVFGSTERAAPIAVRIHAQSLSTEKFSDLLKSQDKTNAVYEGLNYLFFSTRKTKVESERQAILANQRFDCTLLLRSSDNDPVPLQCTYAALWLLTHLGGLGTRARRGAGNLQVVATDWTDQALPPLVVRANTTAELKNELSEGLHALRSWVTKTFNVSESPDFQNPPPADVLHPEWCTINVVNKEFKDWKIALDAFGIAMRDFRTGLKPDSSTIKAALKDSKRLGPIRRAAFGLPIVFYFPSSKQSATLQGENHTRHASPLLVRVTKLATGQYALVLTRFRTALLPEDRNLALVRHGKKQSGPPAKTELPKPDDSILDEFLKRLGECVGPIEQVPIGNGRSSTTTKTPTP